MAGCTPEEKLQHVKDIEVLKNDISYLKDRIEKLESQCLRLGKAVSKLGDTNSNQNESLAHLDASIAILNNQFESHTKLETASKSIQTSLIDDFDAKDTLTKENGAVKPDTNTAEPNTKTAQSGKKNVKIDSTIDSITKIAMLIISIVFFIINGGQSPIIYN